LNIAVPWTLGSRLPLIPSTNHIISGDGIQSAEELSPTTHIVEITPVRLKSQDSKHLQRKVHCAAETVFIFFSFLKNVRNGKGYMVCMDGFHYLGEFISAFTRYSYQS